MLRDQRKATRRSVRYTAWIVREGDELHGCALFDISDTGARIDVEDSDSVPERVALLLSGNGKARRACRVVWRRERQIGVRFEKRLAADDRAKLVVNFDEAPLAPAQDAPPLETGDAGQSESTKA
jgi:hypothetical protein